MPQYSQGYPVNQQSHINSGFVVINQQPSRREIFPYRLQTNWILTFGIAKCILGSLLLIAGVASVILSHQFYKYQTGFAIWCGLTVLFNGIFGCIVKCSQNKCAIGTFLGLSITSLIFDISMLPYYSVMVEFFVDFYNEYCDWGLNGRYCWKYLAYQDKDWNTAIASCLVGLVVFELACSIGSVVVATKAYSKCCNTCNTDDCCTWVGCCECKGAVSNTQQAPQPDRPPYYNPQSIQTSYTQPQYYGPTQQRSQSNPCSAAMSFVINIPSYILGTGNGTQVSAINVDIQPVADNAQAPLIRQDRSTNQTQVTTSLAIGGSQPNLNPTA